MSHAKLDWRMDGDVMSHAKLKEWLLIAQTSALSMLLLDKFLTIIAVTYGGLTEKNAVFQGPHNLLALSLIICFIIALLYWSNWYVITKYDDNLINADSGLSAKVLVLIGLYAAIFTLYFFVIKEEVWLLWG